MIRRGLLAAVLLVLTSAAAHAFRDCDLADTPVVFGVFSGSTQDSVGQITIHCHGAFLSAYTLTLSTGNSGTYISRQMRNGFNTLSYNLFTTPARTQVFGDGSGGTSGVSGLIGSFPDVRFEQVYGRIPAQNLPAAGTYSDTITTTLRCDDFSCTTTSQPFFVTATVLPSCTISAINLAFGEYTEAQLDGLSQISVNCTPGTDWNVGLNEGNFPGATVNTRRMSGPGFSSLGYSLFRDPARVLNWGNANGINTVSGTGTGGVQRLNVFGRIPASQSVPPGGYRDTIVGTITF